MSFQCGLMISGSAMDPGKLPSGKINLQMSTNHYCRDERKKVSLDMAFGIPLANTAKLSECLYLLFKFSQSPKYAKF